MDEGRAGFIEMVQGVRRGDGDAAFKLVSLYEPEVRRIIRVRMTDPRLRRQLDSGDICQSVLGDFFIRVRLGQFDLESPEQLISLLATMARNKLLNHVARQKAGRRDIRKLEETALEELPSLGGDETPSTIAAHHELFQLFRSRLTTEELLLADQRAEGRSWLELAVELNEQADALRKRLQRGIDRVSAELKLEM